MEMWIARDKDGLICLFKDKPIRHDDAFYSNDYLSTSCFALDFDAFPEVTWENSPKKVELKLKEIDL